MRHNRKRMKNMRNEMSEEINEIEPSTLWLFDKRDNSAGQTGWYRGNTPTQVVSQCLLRCTRRGDVVLDPFFGSGTTGFDALRRGRLVIGVELQRSLVRRVAKELHNRYPSKVNNWLLLAGDCRSEAVLTRVKERLRYWNKSAQLLFLHPPYYNMIRFSEDPRCLSNTSDLESFLEALEGIVVNWVRLLNENGSVALVMGDMYREGEWIPLGFLAMERLRRMSELKLNAIIVRSIRNNHALRDREEEWKRFATRNNLFVYGHEYVFLFKRSLCQANL